MVRRRTGLLFETPALRSVAIQRNYSLDRRTGTRRRVDPSLTAYRSQSFIDADKPKRIFFLDLARVKSAPVVGDRHFQGPRIERDRNIRGLRSTVSNNVLQRFLGDAVET